MMLFLMIGHSIFPIVINISNIRHVEEVSEICNDMVIWKLRILNIEFIKYRKCKALAS